MAVGIHGRGACMTGGMDHEGMCGSRHSWQGGMHDRGHG